MAVTRRIFFGGAMAAPLAAQLGGGAAANASSLDPSFALLDGLTEMRLTEFALKQLGSRGVGVQVAGPGAGAILGGDGKTVEGVRLKPEYANLSVSYSGQLGTGRGRVQGGVALVSSKARLEITGIRASMPDGQISAFLKRNSEWLGELPLYVADMDAVRLSVQPGGPSQPSSLKGSGIPVTPTQQGVDAFTEAFGAGLFTTRDVVFTAAGEGRAMPLPYPASH